MNKEAIAQSQEQPKKKTIKQKLVDRMIANGNDFTYTDMIKTLLKIQYGEDREYDWRSPDRGYYSDNFNRTHGYMTRGCGDCGVYKKENGRWSAKYYTKKEKLDYILREDLRNFQNDVINIWVWNQREFPGGRTEYSKELKKSREALVQKLIKKVSVL